VRDTNGDNGFEIANVIDLGCEDLLEDLGTVPQLLFQIGFWPRVATRRGGSRRGRRGGKF